jgi:hypothetical protein
MGFCASLPSVQVLDVAVLKIVGAQDDVALPPTLQFPYAPIGDSDTLEVSRCLH